MKTLSKFLCSFLFILSFTTLSYAQPLQCVSDLSWEVSTNETGPFDIVPVEVTTSCLDPTIISCVCPGNTLPNIGTCHAAMEIWGEEPGCVNNVPCTYPQATYWFRKVVDIDVCQRISEYQIQIQGDNNLTFFLNGTEVLETASNQWNTTFDTNGAGTANQNFNTAVGNALVTGPNEILIRVQNVGNACMNYAFLSFCANFMIEDIDLDAEFTLSDIDNNDGTFNLIGTPTNPTAGENHEWYILSRPSNTIDPYTPVGVIPGPDNLNIVSPYCLDYRVIHRVFIDDCEACFAKNNGGVCDEEQIGNDGGGQEEKRLQPVPCDILDEYEWPVVDGRPGIDGGGKAQENLKPRGTINVSPNPSSGNFSVTWDLAESSTLKIFALDGSLILDRVLFKGQTSIDVEASSWNTGIYIIQILDNNGLSHTEKVEIIK